MNQFTREVIQIIKAKKHKDGRITYNVSTYAESFLKFMELIGTDHPKRSKMMWKDYYEQRGVSI